MSEGWRKGSSARWRTFRAVLLSRWRMQGRTRCEIQGPRCLTSVQEVDHIVPLALGGPKYDPANCRPSCAPCNRMPRPIVGEPSPRSVSNW